MTHPSTVADALDAGTKRVRDTPCPHCSRKVAGEHALQQHIRHRHPRVKGAKKIKSSRVFHRSGADLAETYAMVDALDLPDGAHWAMIEEITGLEPADFAFLSDDLA